MKKINQLLVERIGVFSDSYELAEWIGKYRDHLKEGGVDTEAIYYLEEIRQNIVGQQDLLLEFKSIH